MKKSLLLQIKLIPFFILLFLIELKYKPDRHLRGSNTLIESNPGRFRKASPLPSFRYEFASAELNGSVYVIGGVHLPSVWFPTRLVEKYNLEKDTWITVAPYPKPIHHTGAVSCLGKLYVVGGNGVRIVPRNDVYAYDPVDNTWTRKTNLPVARGALGVVAINNKIYAVGGGINKKPVNILEEYDPFTNTWQTRTPMPTAREHIAAVEAHGKLHVLGGYNGNRFNNLNIHEAYDPLTDTWQKCAPLPYAVSGLAAATVENSIFIVGGEQGWAVSGEIHEYKIKEDRWIRRADLLLPRYALTATTISNSIHIIGGNGYLMGNDFRTEHDVFLP